MTLTLTFDEVDPGDLGVGAVGVVALATLRACYQLVLLVDSEAAAAHANILHKMNKFI